MNWDSLTFIHVVLNSSLPLAGILLGCFSFVWYVSRKSTPRAWTCAGFCLFAIGETVAIVMTLNSPGIDFSYAAIFQLFHAISAVGIIVAAISFGRTVIQEKRQS